MSRIFVVEDEVVVSVDITQTLQHLGYEVVGTAESGVAALIEVERTKPDLILMDIKLAGRLDGIQTAAAIRKRSAIPVIYVTAHSDEATLRRAKDTAPHGYLLKPFSERDLRTAIEVALHKHELEQKLEQRERWFSTTLESVGDAIIATDAGQHITFMNAIAEGITGWKKDDATGRLLGDVFKVVPPEDESQGSPSGVVRRGFRAELAPGAKLLDREGASKEVDESVAPIVDAAGRTLGSVLVFRDITEKRRLEGRLVLAERLSSIATMAAGMAHELNNPLAATVGNLEFAFRRLHELMQQARSADLPWLSQGLTEVNEALADAQSAGARVRRIVTDLKKFARIGETTGEVVDLPDIVQSALGVTQHLVEGRMKIDTRVETTPLVEAPEGQLVQVLANLIANAIQASDTNSQRVLVSTHTDELGRAVIEVKDHGSGIRPEHLSRIFEPFFTTKPPGDGLGLGLSICQSIVTRISGALTVESQLGRGSTFRVVLPAAQDPERKRRNTSAAPASARRARVLVIDDEEMVGRTIERLFNKRHDVVRETDPLAALARLKGDETFDVILCDLNMPNVTGADVFDAVRKMNPQLAKRIVFMTGGVGSKRLEQFLESCPNIVLDKPFSAAKLLAVVASQLPA